MDLSVMPLEKALKTLEEAWHEYQKDFSNTFVRDSVIQRFEYTFEMSHKLLRRFLSEKETNRTEISEMFFSDLIRLGNKRGLLLNDLETWDKYKKARNLTSHNYDEFNADKIIVIIPAFFEDIHYELLRIKERLNEKEININIERHHLVLIIDILKSFLNTENANIYVYGSRVKGKSLKYSDIDVAIDYNGQIISDLLKNKILDAFENSILPYKVDIIDINSISEEFKNKIRKDFVNIFSEG
jgi:nucleotidyltransferase substrate binding protein (TIGR01987 family)